MSYSILDICIYEETRISCRIFCLMLYLITPNISNFFRDISSSTRYTPVYWDWDICVTFRISNSILDICKIGGVNMMRYLTRYFFDILIFPSHIFRFLDPMKDIVRYSDLFKIFQNIFMILWDIHISFEIWPNILIYSVRYLVKFATFKDIARFWRYLIIFQIC